MICAAMCMVPLHKGLAEELKEGIADVIDQLNFAETEKLEVNNPNSGEAMGVKETVLRLASGESISPEAVLTDVVSMFARQMRHLGALALSIILPVIVMSIAVNMGLGGGSFQEIGKNLGMVIVIAPVVICVINELDHVKRTIMETTEKMDKILPLLLTMLTAVGGSASSAFLHPVVVAASGSMVYLAREVILRLVVCSCAITTVNHLSDRMHLSRMAGLLRSGVCWLLGVSFTVFLGAMSVQGICSAASDGIAIRAAKYAVDNFVPIVGGMFSDTMDTLVGCTLIVKNALGVTAMLVLSGTMLLPIIRTFCVAAVMKICTALLEPIASSQIILAIEDFSKTMVLFLITMLCVSTMYFLLIVQVLLVGNLTVMLR